MDEQCGVAFACREEVGRSGKDRRRDREGGCCSCRCRCDTDALALGRGGLARSKPEPRRVLDVSRVCTAHHFGVSAECVLVCRGLQREAGEEGSRGVAASGERGPASKTPPASARLTWKKQDVRPRKRGDASRRAKRSTLQMVDPEYWQESLCDGRMVRRDGETSTFPPGPREAAVQNDRKGGRGQQKTKSKIDQVWRTRFANGPTLAAAFTPEEDVKISGADPCF